MLSKRRMTTGVIALLVTILTATPATASVVQHDDAVQNIINAKTGAKAAKALPKETAGQLSVSVGHDKSGKSMESFSQHVGRSVRMMAVIKDDSQGAVDFTLDLPAGARVVKQDDGSAVVSRPRGAGVTEVLGTIDAPWASDANGKKLATSYTYQAGVLTQQVDTRDAAFPIVADPMIRPGCEPLQGCGIYLNLKGAQLRILAASVTLLVHLGAGITCLAATRLPPPFGVIVAAICFVVGGPSLLSTIRATLRAYNAVKVTNWWCYNSKILPGPASAFRAARLSDCA